MPLLGLIPFLHGKDELLFYDQSGVNALTRANSFSTSNNVVIEYYWDVSMTLLGLIPFLRRNYNDNDNDCVNALTRANSFSTQNGFWYFFRSWMCQCPYSG